MKLNDIIKNEKGEKGVGKSGFYGLYNTFEKILDNPSINEKEFSRYSAYFIKQIDNYTPKDLIYFTGNKIEEINSERENKLLSEYNKAAWNEIAKRYGVEKFFETGKQGYMPKLKNLIYNLGIKTKDEISYLYKQFSEYMKDEGNDKLKGYLNSIKQNGEDAISYGIRKMKSLYRKSNDNDFS